MGLSCPATQARGLKTALTIAGGVSDIILSVGYRAEAIRTHFGDAYGGAQICYAVETKPLGTGGAIAHAAAGEGAAHLLVLNGDTFLDIDFHRLIAWHHEVPATVTIVLRAVADVARYGAVRCEGGRVTGFAEKGQAGPGLINAGIYIIDPSVFAAYSLAGRFAIESDLLQPDLSPIIHPVGSRARTSFEPHWLGDATGRGAEPHGSSSDPSRCIAGSLSLV